MANYLKFDVYDLELSSVKRDSDLRRLLLRTTNRSILVVEDIDCSIELVDRRTANHGIHADFFPRDQKVSRFDKLIKFHKILCVSLEYKIIQF